jgi:hypothetical protein
VALSEQAQREDREDDRPTADGEIAQETAPTDPLSHLTPDQREGLTEIVRLLWPGYMACLAEHQSS